MTLKKIKILTILLLSALTLQGQALIKDAKHLKSFEALPTESIYIHQNASLLLAGEQLYYTLYCINRNTNTKSALSKVAYVELIGANGNHVFRHKISLTLGIGQGDFFIPTSIPTGNYKLLGYTNWMKNGNLDYIFKSDIDIINPYLKNQDLVFDPMISLAEDAISSKEFSNKNLSPKSQNKPVKLSTNKLTFGKREKVQLTLENLIQEEGFGTYSISVRKKSTISEPELVGLNEYLKKSTIVPDQEFIHDSIHLPELRGELLYGRVLNNASGSNVSNVNVALSIPGEDHIVKIAKTNAEGVFYFNLDKRSIQSNAFFQVLGEQRVHSKIIMGYSLSPNLTGLSFDPLKYTPQMAKLLVERSVHNQIENAYLELKRDRLNPILNKKQFYQKYDYEFNLDDYTRFTSIKEVILEVVDYVRTAKNQDGIVKLLLRDYNNTQGFREEPLVLVDGLLLQDHQEIIDVDARKVKKISLRLQKFRFGPKTYNGIIAFETNDGMFPRNYKNEYVYIHEMFSPLGQKQYFKQEYLTNSNNAIEPLPDFRYQLLWEPTYEFNAQSKPIEFYTSDVSGNFEISIEGISSSGNPITLRANFTVE